MSYTEIGQTLLGVGAVSPQSNYSPQVLEMMTRRAKYLRNHVLRHSRESHLLEAAVSIAPAQYEYGTLFKHPEECQASGYNCECSLCHWATMKLAPVLGVPHGASSGLEHRRAALQADPYARHAAN